MVTRLCICCMFLIVINVASAQNPCKTPDNFNGTCIAVKQCRSINRLLNTDLSTEQRNFLRNSQCDGDGDNIFVCCPNKFTVNDLPSTKFCGTQVTDKIVGGDDTSLNEFPWMVLLHYRKRAGKLRGWFCGGTLIHENYVLTAAHCIRSRNMIQQKLFVDSVRLGEHDLRTDPDCQSDDECADPAKDIPVAEIIVHENYAHTSSSQANDIALIRLEHAAPFTDYIRPICLPVAQKLLNKSYDDSPMTVAGFGKTENASRSDVKLKLAVNGFNLQECAKIFAREIGIKLTNDKQLCAGGEDNKDSCEGDSGGPLVAEESADAVTKQDAYAYLVGIVSLGPKPCGKPGVPGVYTRVDQYIQWILDNMKK